MLPGDRDGASAVEFAIMLPLLMTLVAGLCDFGLAMFTGIQVQQAAQAGAEYALLKGDSNLGAIQTAEQNATIFGSAITAGTPAVAYYCMSDLTTAVTSTTTCSGETAGKYVTVTASKTYTTLIPWPGIPSSISFSARSIVRIS
jgi:Flp pilus assembly protein TadG